MTHHPSQPETVEEFLELRSTVRHDTALLDKLDGQLRDMAASDPDQAASILHALSRSGDKDDRDAAAIYVSHLFATRTEQAREILLTLLHDTNDDVRRQALDTLDTVTEGHQLTATQAARLIAHRVL